MPDKSTFKQQFLAALQGEGDTNHDGYVTGNELGEFLQTNVVNYTRQAQHPQYGKIQDPQLDKGDFVFVPPAILPPSTVFDPSSYETEANRLGVAKAQWNKWQNDMNAGFQKAQTLDGNPNLTAAAKAQMWREFLTAFANDNPHSSDDETLRREAGSRQNYWRTYQPAKLEPTPPTVENKTTRRYTLRATPRNDFSLDDQNKMLVRWGFFEAYDNKNGSGLENQYELRTIGSEQVVVDAATGLMWQRSGSANAMNYVDAEKYIQQLNSVRFAGFSNWRLPTLEEAMSLMESKKSGELYLDPIFDRKQSWIWTADKESAGRAWFVIFSYGFCDHVGLGGNGLVFVRAVRS